jgi:positive regulator of sigma E activity
VFFLLIGLCAMAYLMPLLGFFLTSLLVTAFMLYVIEPQKWWAVLATSLASCIAVYLLFGYLLDIRLPTGFLGI